MRATTNYNRRTRLDASFAELWSRASIFGITHEAMLIEEAAIRERLGFSKLPQVDRAWLSGRQSMRLEMAYRHDIRWTLAERDGVFIERWDDLSEDEAQAFRENRVTGWHRWAGNNRPFSRDVPQTLVSDGSA